MSRSRVWLSLAALGALPVLLAVLARQQGWNFDATEAQVVDTIRGYGAWGMAISVLLMVAHCFLPFPAEVIALANGMVYGSVKGTAVSWAGAMIGAWLSFGLARLLGRGFAEAMLARGKWRTLDRLAQSQGAKMVLVARLIPVIAFNLINYAAGLTAISWWNFTWATAIGSRPRISLISRLGARMQEATWETWAMTGFGVLMLLLLLLPKVRRL